VHEGSLMFLLLVLFEFREEGDADVTSVVS